MRWWSTLEAAGRVLPTKYMLLMRRQSRVKLREGILDRGNYMSVGTLITTKPKRV